MSFALAAPDPWFAVPEGEREARGILGSDNCVMDVREFYIRGCLEFPLREKAGPFVWSVWVSVWERSYSTILQFWDVEQRDHVAPMFGWLSNSISVYPQTGLLKTNADLRNDAMRPFIELEPKDHLLALEQRKASRSNERRNRVGGMHLINIANPQP
jgi:hypothetical protein